MIKGGRKIMKATSFETAVDDYNADNIGFMDKEMLDTVSVKDDFYL